MKYSGIYKITNLINNKCYIGQSVDIARRWHDERAATYSPTDVAYDAPLIRAFRKYGLENFKFEIIEQCSVDLLNERESYWANYYQCYVPNGYNVAYCGKQGNWHFNTLTPEILDRITDDLLNSSLTQTEIGKKYGLSLDGVSRINLGKQCWRQGIDYPIRKSPCNRNGHEKEICPNCGGPKDHKAALCVNCYRKSVMKEIPIEVLDCVYTKGMVAGAQMMGITDNALRKQLKVRNIPYKKAEYRQWYEENMLNKE